MKHMTKYLAGIALSLAVSAANAASITLRPESLFVAPESTLSLDLLVDFGTPGTTGGATDITFDSRVLSFSSFVFDPAFGPLDSDFIPPNRDTFFDKLIYDKNTAPNLLTIGFGNFAGIEGAFTAGRLQFSVAKNVQNQQRIDLSIADSAKWFGFFDFSGHVMPVNYTGATVTAVPLPSSAWLFATGLAMLGMLRLRRGAQMWHDRGV